MLVFPSNISCGPYCFCADFFCSSRRRHTRCPLVTGVQTCALPTCAAYLGLPGDRPDFVHLTPENSRRLRALAAWFALAAYGRAGHRDIVERNVAAARTLARRIGANSRFALLAPVHMNVVCFTLAGSPGQSDIEAFLKRVSDPGETFLTTTVLHGNWAIRAAFPNWRSHDRQSVV